LFFINIGGLQGHATPLKSMSKWANRSLPVTVRNGADEVLHQLGWAAGPVGRSERSATVTQAMRKYTNTSDALFNNPQKAAPAGRPFMPPAGGHRGEIIRFG